MTTFEADGPTRRVLAPLYAAGFVTAFGAHAVAANLRTHELGRISGYVVQAIYYSSWGIAAKSPAPKSWLGRRSSSSRGADAAVAWAMAYTSMPEEITAYVRTLGPFAHPDAHRRW